MADNKGGNVIIVKKVDGGHAAPHGGGWKVAFADFMTAMMAFFLVMWLLGSDEEVKSQIAHYFNNPTSAWRPDLASKETVPLGEWTGVGEGLTPGAQGQVPEDLVESPDREFKQFPEPKSENESMIDEIYGNNVPDKIDFDIFKFSLREETFFPGVSDQFHDGAQKSLAKLKRVLQGFNGRMMIRGFSSPAPRDVGNAYEFATTRTVAIKKYLVQNNYIDETRVLTSVKDQRRSPANNARVIEFILKGPNAE